MTPDPGGAGGASDASGEGLRRAFERAAAKAGTQEGPVDDALRVLTFSLAGEWYGFRLTELVEIIGSVEPAPIPFSSPHVAGVMNHRGALVPVVDLRRVFHLPPQFRRGIGRTVLIRSGTTMLALPADAISDIVAIPPDGLEPPPATMERARAACLEGCAPFAKGLLAVLSARALVEALSARDD